MKYLASIMDGNAQREAMRIVALTGEKGLESYYFFRSINVRWKVLRYGVLAVVGLFISSWAQDSWLVALAYIAFACGVFVVFRCLKKYTSFKLYELLRSGAGKTAEWRATRLERWGTKAGLIWAIYHLVLGIFHRGFGFHIPAGPATASVCLMWLTALLFIFGSRVRDKANRRRTAH